MTKLGLISSYWKWDNRPSYGYYRGYRAIIRIWFHIIISKARGQKPKTLPVLDCSCPAPRTDNAAVSHPLKIIAIYNFLLTWGFRYIWSITLKKWKHFLIRIWTFPFLFRKVRLREYIIKNFRIVKSGSHPGLPKIQKRKCGSEWKYEDKELITSKGKKWKDFKSRFATTFDLSYS